MEKNVKQRSGIQAILSLTPVHWLSNSCKLLFGLFTVTNAKGMSVYCQALGAQVIKCDYPSIWVTFAICHESTLGKRHGILFYPLSVCSTWVGELAAFQRTVQVENATTSGRNLIPLSASHISFSKGHELEDLVQVVICFPGLNKIELFCIILSRHHKLIQIQWALNELRTGKGWLSHT